MSINKKKQKVIESSIFKQKLLNEFIIQMLKFYITNEIDNTMVYTLKLKKIFPGKIETYINKSLYIAIFDKNAFIKHPVFPIIKDKKVKKLFYQQLFLYFNKKINIKQKDFDFIFKEKNYNLKYKDFYKKAKGLLNFYEVVIEFINYLISADEFKEYSKKINYKFNHDFDLTNIENYLYKIPHGIYFNFGTIYIDELKNQKFGDTNMLPLIKLRYSNTDFFKIANEDKLIEIYQKILGKNVPIIDLFGNAFSNFFIQGEKSNKKNIIFFSMYPDLEKIFGSLGLPFNFKFDGGNYILNLADDEIFNFKIVENIIKNLKLNISNIKIIVCFSLYKDEHINIMNIFDYDEKNIIINKLNNINNSINLINESPFLKAVFRLDENKFPINTYGNLDEYKYNQNKLVIGFLLTNKKGDNIKKLEKFLPEISMFSYQYYIFS